jgi:hypothetical protein
MGLAYFGQINPRIFDNRGEDFDWFLPPPAPGSVKSSADLPPRYRYNREAYRLKPGLYAVSASLLEGLPWRVYDNNRWAPYPVWTDAFSYFKSLRPFHKVGYSIYLYRVTAAQAETLSPVWDAPFRSP